MPGFPRRPVPPHQPRGRAVSITAEEFEALVRRSLAHGVPTAVVAEVFALTEAVVKRVKRDILIEQYATADQAEYLEWLQWQTLERCYRIISEGAPADVTKIATAVLGRQIATQGKRSSEAQRAAAERLEETMAKMRSGAVREAEPGRFVVREDA